MFVEEVDATLVDALGDGLANLVRAPALDHIQSRPTVLCLGSGGSSDEETVPELSLEVVLLDVICQEGGNLPIDNVLDY